MKNKPLKQGGTGGNTSATRYAVGSGSRPGGGKITTPSSNPSSAQKIRTGK